MVKAYEPIRVSNFDKKSKNDSSEEDLDGITFASGTSKAYKPYSIQY